MYPQTNQIEQLDCLHSKEPADLDTAKSHGEEHTNYTGLLEICKLYEKKKTIRKSYKIKIVKTASVHYIVKIFRNKVGWKKKYLSDDEIQNIWNAETSVI